MGWMQGIPFLARMPEAYRDREETSWLTTAWDELLIATRNLAEATYTTHLDPQTANPENLDWLAQHFGFTEEFWDETWSTEVKRTLLLNAYRFIWAERGTERVINWMLALHQIPAVLPHQAIYYPDWFRAFDWVLVVTRDFAEGWTEASGTSGDLLLLILEALQIQDYEIQGDVVILPYGGDGLHKPDLERAIALYSLPYRVGYDRFFAGIGVAGDPVFVGTSYDPTTIPSRNRTHPDAQAIYYPALRDPFWFAIRLNSEIVKRGDAVWVLADRLSDTYAPLYMQGGVCFGYFRAGMSAAGEPSFDPDYDFSYPIVKANYSATTTALFATLIEAYGWNATPTLIPPQLLIRFADGLVNGDRGQIETANKLIRWYSPWGLRNGSQACWEYFYAGLSVAGEPTFDWLQEKLAPQLAGLSGVEAIEVILGFLGITSAELLSPFVLVPTTINPTVEANLKIALMRYLPGWSVSYDRFYAGRSVAGDPVTDWLGVEIEQAIQGLSESGAILVILEFLGLSGTIEPPYVCVTAGTTPTEMNALQSRLDLHLAGVWDVVFDRFYAGRSVAGDPAW